MEMVGNTFIKELPGLIKEGKVKEAEIDNAVRNILRIKYLVGLFENPSWMRKPMSYTLLLIWKPPNRQPQSLLSY